MKRRSFLILAGFGVTAAGVAVIKTVIPPVRQHRERPVFLSNVCDDETLHSLGEAWLRQHPVERSRTALVTLIYGKDRKISAIHGRSRATMRKIGNLIREDFLCGRIAIVEGWVVSLTEVRQCALFCITNN